MSVAASGEWVGSNFPQILLQQLERKHKNRPFGKKPVTLLTLVLGRGSGSQEETECRHSWGPRRPGTCPTKFRQASKGCQAAATSARHPIPPYHLGTPADLGQNQKVIRGWASKHWQCNASSSGFEQQRENVRILELRTEMILCQRELGN